TSCARSRSSGAWATPLIDHSDQPQWWLNHLKGLTGLHTLDLGLTSVGDPGLAPLEGMVSLDTRDLAGTKVTDAREKPAGDPVELPWPECRDFVSEVTSGSDQPLYGVLSASVHFSRSPPFLRPGRTRAGGPD